MTGDETVQKRAVYFIGGYDPKNAQEFFARLQRELARFEALWEAKAEVSPVVMSADGDIGSVTITTRGQGWAVDTNFNFIELDRMVRRDFARPLPVRALRYLAAFLDFVLSGVMFRMFRVGWRFALYFLFPFVAIVLFMLLGVAAGIVTTHFAPAYPALAGIVVGVAVYGLAQRFLGARFPINHLMDLWSFSSEFLHGRRPGAETQMQAAAEAIVAAAREERPDELLLVGHSTGGALILDVAARCLAADPDFAAYSPNISLLTLGSTALKIGMHPAAKQFRKDVQSLVEERRIGWVEIQCLTDIINFYKSAPVTEMRLTPRAGEEFPLVRQVRMKHMLSDETYRRIRRNFFRIHYQYVFGNTKPYFYDFFIICCGPQHLQRRMERRLVGRETGDAA